VVSAAPGEAKSAAPAPTSAWVSIVTEYVEPLGMRILVRKDENRQKTRGGIVLPDDAEIPTITGRVVEISAQVERDEDFPIRKYDKILFHPKRAIPVDLEPDNKLFVVPVEDVCAVFRRSQSPSEPIQAPDAESREPS
jgi:chaperonin GroES